MPSHSDKYSKKFPRLRPAPADPTPRVRFVRFSAAEERAMARACADAQEFMQSFGSGREPVKNGCGYFRDRPFLEY